MCPSKVDKIIGVEDIQKSPHATINRHTTNGVGPVYCPIKWHNMNTVEPVPFPVDRCITNAVDPVPFSEDWHNANAVSPVSFLIKQTQTTSKNYSYAAAVIKNKSMATVYSGTTGNFL